MMPSSANSQSADRSSTSLSLYRRSLSHCLPRHSEILPFVDCVVWKRHVGCSDLIPGPLARHRIAGPQRPLCDKVLQSAAKKQRHHFLPAVTQILCFLYTIIDCEGRRDPGNSGLQPLHHRLSALSTNRIPPPPPDRKSDHCFRPRTAPYLPDNESAASLKDDESLRRHSNCFYSAPGA